MKYLKLLWLGLLCVSCNDDGYFGPVYLNHTITVSNLSSSRLIVGCEGNFQSANASISEISLDEQTVDNEVFLKRNGYGVGDVVQSIYQRNDSIFVVVNNSGLVRILTSDSLIEIGKVSGLQSPRHVFLRSGSMLVSDLYSNEITEIDLSTLSSINKYPVEGWTERFISFGQKIVVANIKQRSILIYDEDMQYERLIQLQLEPHFLFEFNGDLFAVGPKSQANQGMILKRLNANFTVLDSLITEYPFTYASLDQSQLYVLSKKKVIKINLRNVEQRQESTLDLVNPYSISINRTNKHLFISDANDYLSFGEVIEYDSTARLRVSSYKVGYIPQAMHFAL